jgi:putative ABC transport system permease protein
VIIGRKLAARFGWKIGDRIPLKSPGYLGGGSWDFNVRGLYHGTRPQDDETQFWMHHRYMYEKGPEFWKGIVGWYVVRVADPNAAPEVLKAIDAEFANSSSETRTQTESAFAASFVKQMGNIEFLIMVIGSIVFFTLLLVTGNTMAISVRERTNELAVLKAIGYSDRFVLGLVLAESILIAVVGGGLGLLAGRAITARDLTNGIILMYLPVTAGVAGVFVALATGLLAGLLPAISAMRLSVVSALRRV